jgi:hypothetical protein
MEAPRKLVRSLHAALHSVPFTKGFSQLNWKQPAWANWHFTSRHHQRNVKINNTQKKPEINSKSYEEIFQHISNKLQR